jgi:hypothetical protein
MTSYTLSFLEDREDEPYRVNLEPFVISNFTSHMMNSMSGTRHMASSRRRRCRCLGQQSCVICDPVANALTSNPNLDESIMDPLGILGGRRLEDMFRTPPVPRKSKIATFKSDTDLGHCSICFDTIKRGQMMCRLPCKNDVSHAFHKKCIVPWLEKNNTCPNCRSEI